MSLTEWGPVDHYMQSVCANMAINYDKPVKIANLLSSSFTLTPYIQSSVRNPKI